MKVDHIFSQTIQRFGPDFIRDKSSEIQTLCLTTKLLKCCSKACCQTCKSSADSRFDTKVAPQAIWLVRL